MNVGALREALLGSSDPWSHDIILEIFGKGLILGEISGLKEVVALMHSEVDRVFEFFDLAFVDFVKVQVLFDF